LELLALNFEPSRLISGVVNSQQSIDRSQEIARSLKEVKSVESELVVKGAE
jgi:hypothetical protein